MSLPYRNILPAIALAVMVPGCTSGGTSAESAKPAGEVPCFVATDPIQCKVGHGLAGGEAIQVIGTDP